jgi:hypothetical protein
MKKSKKPALPAVPSRSEILERDPIHEVAQISFRDSHGAPVRSEVTTRELVSAGILLRLNSYLRHLAITDPETGQIVGSADPLEQLATLMVHPRVVPLIRAQCAKELARIIYPNGITADAGTIVRNVLDAAAAPEEKIAYVGPKRRRGRPRRSPAIVTDVLQNMGAGAPRAIVPIARPDDVEMDDGEDEMPILDREPDPQPSLETPLHPAKRFDLEIEPVQDPRIQPGWRTEDPLTKQRMLAEYLRSVQ